MGRRIWNVIHRSPITISARATCLTDKFETLRMPTTTANQTHTSTQQYLPLKTRERMRAMLSARESVAKIARECGIDGATVYREKGRVTGSGSDSTDS